MALRLSGQTSGYVELEAPAVAGDNTVTLPTSNGAANQVLKNGATAGQLEYGLTLPSGSGSAHQVLKNSATPGTLEYGVALPSGNGTSGQYLQTAGDGTTSWATVADTGVVWGEQTGTSTTGTTFNFSSIPADARETIVTWKNVSSDGTGNMWFRIGTSGALATSGYTTLTAYFGTGGSFATNHSTICEFSPGSGAAYEFNGFVRVTRISGNKYEIFGVSSTPSHNYMNVCNSSNDIGGDLGQIEFFWQNSRSFDGGDWGIRYLT